MTAPDPEILAEQWHEVHYDELDHCYDSHWLSCMACKHTNPHYDEAKAQMATKETG
jgi:hypothetical protein